MRADKEPGSPAVDPTSFTAATLWCILENPDLCAGGAVIEGVQTLFRKASADQVKVGVFEPETRKRFPHVRLEQVPRSFNDLSEIRASLLADEELWARHGLFVNGGTITLSPADGAVLVEAVPASSMKEADILFAARYGAGTVRAVSWGGGL